MSDYEGISPGFGGRGGPEPFRISPGEAPALGLICLKPCCGVPASSGVPTERLLLLAEEWIPRVAKPFEIEFPTAVKEGELGALGGEDGKEGFLLSRFEGGTGGVGVDRIGLMGVEESLVLPPLPESNPRSL